MFVQSNRGLLNVRKITLIQRIRGGVNNDAVAFFELNGKPCKAYVLVHEVEKATRRKLEVYADGKDED